MYTSAAYTDISLMEEYPFHGVFYKLAETVDDDGDYGLSDDDDEEDSLSEDGDYGLSDDDEEAASESAAEESLDEDSEETVTDETDETSDSTETSDGSESEETEDAEDSDSSEIIILETPCDIQQNTALFAGTSITRGYKVYFPFNPDIADLPEELKPGILFRGEMYGLTVAGTVLDPVASMMGGCMVEIRGTDI